MLLGGVLDSVPDLVRSVVISPSFEVLAGGWIQTRLSQRGCQRDLKGGQHGVICTTRLDLEHGAGRGGRNDH